MDKKLRNILCDHTKKLKHIRMRQMKNVQVALFFNKTLVFLQKIINS